MGMDNHTPHLKKYWAHCQRISMRMIGALEALLICVHYINVFIVVPQYLGRVCASLETVESYDWAGLS
jgi:hypothetical protein